MVNVKREGLASPFLVVLLFLLFLIPFGMYCIGLPGGFEFDDGINIVRNDFLKLTSIDFHSLEQAALSTGAGPLRRPVVMLSFALNYYFFGEDVLSFKLANIFIHSLNAVLTFFLVSLVLRRLEFQKNVTYLSLGVALYWSLLPINLTSVLYVVQRMVSMGGLFALTSMVCWLNFRRRLEQDQKFIVIWAMLFFVCFVFAVLCKETYVLIGLAIYLMESLLFSRNCKNEIVNWRIMTSVFVMVVITTIAILLFNPSVIIGEYTHRPFDLVERLLTQSRVIVFYISQIILPSNIALGLYHDDFLVSHSLLNPISTLLSVILISALLFLAFVIRHQNRLFSFGVFWFFCWHILESTVVSLEMVHEHRNYIATIGILLSILGVFIQIEKKIRSKFLIAFSISIFFVFSSSILFLRLLEWNNLVSHALAEIDHHPGSVRARYQMGRIYFLVGLKHGNKNYLKLSIKSFQEAISLSKYDLLPWFGMLRVKALTGDDVTEDVDKLAAKLRGDKLPTSTIVALDVMQDCIVAEQCSALSPFYTQLIDATLDNKNLTRGDRSQLVGLKASYYARIKNDPELVVESLTSGLSQNPKDFMLRKGLLYYYVTSPDLVQAKAELRGFESDFASDQKAMKIANEMCGILSARGVTISCDTK
ncbi:hypothetical protein FT643_03415 [Ketobacter sp. MCCC 1A13808]|uniref:hypothetical protein n=1 Tax=Ketobacter sp. MCCC 1A13808 TaxID=2602738 RepID=UPI0012EBA51B|nr:hypothetical protein [Ketobacter sp. MCCC 1A13808]MVF11186.1 hypothetical protein [Ketobacter sp. MCCC 1A13808]